MAPGSEQKVGQCLLSYWVSGLSHLAGCPSRAPCSVLLCSLLSQLAALGPWRSSAGVSPLLAFLVPLGKGLILASSAFIIMGWGNSPLALGPLYTVGIGSSKSYYLTIMNYTFSHFENIIRHSEPPLSWVLGMGQPCKQAFQVVAVGAALLTLLCACSLTSLWV